MFVMQAPESIKKQIATIGRTGVRLILAIQSAAIQCIAHTVKHGDITLANQLIAATPKHQRASLIAFFEVYGPFAYMKADKQLAYFKGNKALKDVMGKDLSEEYVDALPKWDSMVKPPEPKSVYDVQEECDKFLTRIRKLAADSTLEVRNKTLLNEMLATYNKFVAKQALGDAAENATGENVHIAPPVAVNQ
jgi:hypothetical protein